MEPRPTRSPARFLAPLALIVAVVAFLAIVSGSGGGGGSSSQSGTTTSPTSSSATTTSSATTKTTSSAKKKKKKAGATPSTYTVQVGDTLGGIADKTGVPLSKIQELNPAVDPHAMVAGQQIKLK